MAKLITEETITAGWLAATDCLNRVTGRREQFNLVTAIADTDPGHADSTVTTRVNRFLQDTGRQNIETVANTIFPVGIAASSTDRARLYARYLALLPSIRKHPKNR